MSPGGLKRAMVCVAIAFSAAGGAADTGCAVLPTPSVSLGSEVVLDVSAGVRLSSNLPKEEEERLAGAFKAAMPNVAVVRQGDAGVPVDFACTRPCGEWGKADTIPELQGYEITPRAGGISVSAPTPTGLFYAIQTLAQCVEGTALHVSKVEDSPRFAYRGLMVDCSRHFWPKEFLMKQMDAMAAFKLNRLHLHLTDAAGWRLEMQGWPRLTEATAYRTAEDWDRWWTHGPRTYCTKDTPGAYGGFYTRKDIVDIVAYAAERHIMVIPEIELPGHSEETTYAYPGTACEGADIPCADLCPGGDRTYAFLESVLDEVMAMFPSPYIHLGGDEAAGKAWETCGRCRERMASEGLSSTKQLQGYIMGRMARYLSSRGRQAIGWDEMDETGMPPGAIAMVWRGVETAAKVAKGGNRVIMSPSKHCYLDYYQDAPVKEPKAMATYTPLSKAYALQPVPEGLEGTPAAGNIMGVQGNLWTEYIADCGHAEYMLYPRLLAISEKGWARSGADYAVFRGKAKRAAGLLAERGYKVFDLDSEAGEREESLSPARHAAVGKPVAYNLPYNAVYNGGGNTALTDGKRGSWTYGGSPWQGFISGNRLDVAIDMGGVVPVTDVAASFMQSAGAEIYAPGRIVLSVSTDGAAYKVVDDVDNGAGEAAGYAIYDYEWRGGEKARFIRLQAFPGRLGGWIFTDEVEVNRH